MNEYVIYLCGQLWFTFCRFRIICYIFCTDKCIEFECCNVFVGEQLFEECSYDAMDFINKPTASAADSDISRLQ